MKKKNKFKRVKEHGYVVIVDGHTTFPEDICRMLDRLDFLEKERLKRSDNSDYTKSCRNCEHLFWCVEEGYQDMETPKCPRWKRHDFA